MRRAWFFDLDGTLLDLAPTPVDVQVPAGLLEDLATLARRDVVALVSGRALHDVARLMALERYPQFYSAGNHGQELVGPGWSFQDSRGLPGQAALRALRPAIEAAVADVPGSYLEWKDWSISVHDRLATDADHARLGRTLAQLLDPVPDLELRAAKRAWEIRPRHGPTKADAVAAILRQADLAAGTPPCRVVICGDDHTDQDAFAAYAGRALTLQVGTDPVLPGALAQVAAPADLRWALHALASSYCHY